VVSWILKTGRLKGKHHRKIMSGLTEQKERKQSRKKKNFLKGPESHSRHGKESAFGTTCNSKKGACGMTKHGRAHDLMGVRTVEYQIQRHGKKKNGFRMRKSTQKGKNFDFGGCAAPCSNFRKPRGKKKRMKGGGPKTLGTLRIVGYGIHQEKAVRCKTAIGIKKS